MQRYEKGTNKSAFNVNIFRTKIKTDIRISKQNKQQNRTMAGKVLLTESGRERIVRDRNMYKDYKKLMAVEGQKKMAVVRHLMEKYNVKSQGSIYLMLKRGESVDIKKYQL